MPPDAIRRAAEARISKAENDLLNIANNLAAPPDHCPSDTVCFHAQQAAEKYLKALLTFGSIPFPKIHDLTELIVLLPADSPTRKGSGGCTLLPVGETSLTHNSQGG